MSSAPLVACGCTARSARRSSTAMAIGPGSRPPGLAHDCTESATLNAAHGERAVFYSSSAGELAEAQAAWGEAARLYEQAIAVAEAIGSGGESGPLLHAAGR